MKQLLFLFLLFGISCSSSSQPTIEIISISPAPDPQSVPYPNGASICLCKNQAGEKILVALPSFKDRKMLPAFTALKPGSQLVVELIPWAEHADQLRAMAISNDFADEFDLRIYYAPSS